MQYDGKLDVKSLSFGARDLRPFAAMGLAKGVVTSKPEDYLHKHTGYANMCRGTQTQFLCHLPVMISLSNERWLKRVFVLQAPRLCSLSLQR